MSENENQMKQTVLRLYEEVGNQGRLEVLDEIAWPDHVEHNPFPQQSQGVEGLKQRVSMVRAAFNPRFTIEHLVAEGTRWQLCGAMLVPTWVSGLVFHRP